MSEHLVNVESIRSYFESLSDPRRERGRKHLLGDVIVIAVCGILCGADGPTAIPRWALNRCDWLRGVLALPNGLPSRDGIRRVLIALQPAAFQKCFQAWTTATFPMIDTKRKRLIAVDGKTCCNSHDAKQGLGALPIVSAWATAEGIALGQVATAEKSNEITAIPELLQSIDLKDSIVTIDAVGCQKQIAATIVAGQGDFVIAVKDHPPKLREALADAFHKQIDQDLEDLRYSIHTTLDESHGRIDERAYFVRKIPIDFCTRKEWPWVKAIGYSVRISQPANGTETIETRFYILNRRLSCKRFSEAVRGHWGIESRHWVLDVNFREDDSRTRERTLGNNLSWLRRFAVTRLKRHPIKDSQRGQMSRCLMNPDFLTEVLTGS